MAQVERIQGTLRYVNDKAELEEDGRRSLMAIDKPPLGTIQKEDLWAATSLFRDFFGNDDGDRICVQGIRDRIGPRDLILIVRPC